MPEADPSPDDCQQLAQWQWPDRFKDVTFHAPGGMSCIFTAYDTQAKERVAIKRLRHDATADDKARFREEIETIQSRLKHWCIVQFYVPFLSESPPFFTMRLMEGGDLAQRLDDVPLSPEQIAPILQRIAAALDYAHGQGVIHRDIKPGNILFDAEGNAFISDFGIAHAVDKPRHADQTVKHTTPPVQAFTQRYASPEQVRHEPIDKSTDIYSLGIVLFEMLTQRQLFASDERPRTEPQKGVSYLEENVRAFPAAEPYLPLLRKALADLPEERYATAGALYQAFEQLRNPPPPAVLPDWVRPALITLLGLITVAFFIVFLRDIVPSAGPPAGPPEEATVVEMATAVVTAPATSPLATPEGKTPAPVTPSPLASPPPASPTATPTNTAAATTPTPAVTPPTAGPPTVSPAGPAVVTTERARVRAGPGTLYDVLTVLVRGVRAVVLGRAQTEDGQWYNIEMDDGRRGWISDLVVLLTGATPEEVPLAATIPAPPPPGGAATPTATPGGPATPTPTPPDPNNPPPPPTTAATVTDTPIPEGPTPTDTPIPE